MREFTKMYPDCMKMEPNTEASEDRPSTGITARYISLRGMASKLTYTRSVLNFSTVSEDVCLPLKVQC
jgi:hypothetical protein